MGREGATWKVRQRRSFGEGHLGAKERGLWGEEKYLSQDKKYSDEEVGRTLSEDSEAKRPMSTRWKRRLWGKKESTFGW